MLTFLFWNVGGNRAVGFSAQKQKRHRLTRAITEIIASNQVDILMLAEFAEDDGGLVRSLRRNHQEGFRRADPESKCARIKIFSRFPSRFMRILEESPHHTARSLELPDRPSLLLFIVHFPSKLYEGEDSQALEMVLFNLRIRNAERSLQHRRTVVVGDFNMNPFEAGMVGAQGFNAVMSKQVAAKGSRIENKNPCAYLYNPMWGHFGDRHHEIHPIGTAKHDPPGTCYYSSRESKWYFWNMFDQVLLRPELLPFFRNDELSIVTMAGATSLLTDHGVPDREGYSDHLPILFRLRA